MTPPETLATERLLLRRPALDDAEAIFTAYASDPEVTRYLPWKPHRSAAETRAFLQRCLDSWQKGSTFPWVLTERRGGPPMGMIELRSEGTSADIGYVLARAQWGRGFMTEALKAVLDWTLGQEGVWRVGILCDVDNVASARVMEKAGLQREGLLRRRLMHPNVSPEPRDAWLYAKTQ